MKTRYHVIACARKIASWSKPAVALSMFLFSLPIIHAQLPPVITALTPPRQVVKLGASIALSVAANEPALTNQWRRGGRNIAGATRSSCSLLGAAGGDGGSTIVAWGANAHSRANVPEDFRDVVAVREGDTTGLPVIVTQPAASGGVTHSLGDTVVFTVTASGGTELSYQWCKDGAPISGATEATYTIASVTACRAGVYSVNVSNSSGTTTSHGASLLVNVPGRLTNLAIRTSAGTGAQTLIMGITIGGNGVQGAKPLLVRGVGPSLAAFGVSGMLADPSLTLCAGATPMHSNDDWGGNLIVAAMSAQVGAFALGSAASRDAALVTWLPSGSYTVRITGADNSMGLALAEVYETSSPEFFTADTPRLMNVSARTFTGSGGEILIAGFTVGGSNPLRLLIRGVGPTLADFGVTGALADPLLTLYCGATPGGSNDNWGGAAEIAAAAQSVGAFPLNPESRDAALLVSLPPGSYTAQVTGARNTTGVALIELYTLP